MKLEPSKEIVTKKFLQLPSSHQEVILTTAIEYEKLNQQEKLLKARRDKQLRPIIEGATDAYGIEDTNGHMHLVMEGAEVVRTKKISRILNEISAEAVLKKHNIYDSCVQQVVSWEIDEEKIIEAYEAGLLTAAELDDMFSEKISWATSVKTDDSDVAEIVNTRKAIEKSEERRLPSIEEEL